MQATPGPWLAYRIDEQDEIGVMTPAEEVICRAFEACPNAEANAHLVAAAPELLTAVEQAYLGVAAVIDRLPIEAGHLATPLERVTQALEQVLFRAKRAEGRH